MINKIGALYLYPNPANLSLRVRQILGKILAMD
jgi:hypothetical protein